VPILETPAYNPLYGKHYLIFESRHIMDFLDMKLHLNLYSPDAFIKAS
jgi:glutathione S-transferase